MAVSQERKENKLSGNFALALNREIILSDPPQILGSSDSSRSTVFRAKWNKLDVALKILHAEEGDMDLITRELEAIRDLEHPNIVHVLAVVEDLPTRTGLLSGFMGILMEYAVHGDLSSYLSTIAHPSRKNNLRFALDISSALRFCHSRGYIHREVKTSNILITEDLRAKLSDFGMLKALDSNSSSTSFSPRAATAAALSPSSAKYTAPELLSGERVCRPSCDVWSFGVVMWEMLSGKQAFDKMTVEQIAAAVLAEGTECSLLADIPADWRGGTDTLVRSCLRRNHDERPSFDEIQESVRSLYERVVSKDFEDSTAPPFSYFCPISHEIMVEPVVTTDGYSYDRFYIESWLEKHNTSPVTNSVLANKALISNRTLKQAIAEWTANVSRSSIPPAISGLLEAEKAAAAEAAKLPSAAAVVAFVAAERLFSTSCGVAAALFQRVCEIVSKDGPQIGTQFGDQFWSRLTRALGEHASSALVAQHGLAAVAGFASDAKSRIFLSDSGVCAAVCAALRGHSTNAIIAEQGCRALCSLADNDVQDQSEPVRRKLEQAGACGVVAQILRNQTGGKSSVALAEWNCRAVLCLARNDSFKRAFGEAGVCALIVQATRSHPTNSAVLVQALKAINHLAFHDANRSRLGEAGACKAAVAALQEIGQNDAATAEAGVATVRSLARSSANKTRLIEAGAYEATATTLRAHLDNREVADTGCKAILSLLPAVDGLSPLDHSAALSVSNKSDLVKVVSAISAKHPDLASAREVADKLDPARSRRQGAASTPGTGAGKGTGTGTGCSHAFSQKLCRICIKCGYCTGYGKSCVRVAGRDRSCDKGRDCGCGTGCPGCMHCGMCKKCCADTSAPAQPPAPNMGADHAPELQPIQRTNMVVDHASVGPSDCLEQHIGSLSGCGGNPSGSARCAGRGNCSKDCQNCGANTHWTCCGSSDPRSTHCISGVSREMAERNKSACSAPSQILRPVCNLMVFSPEMASAAALPPPTTAAAAAAASPGGASAPAPAPALAVAVSASSRDPASGGKLLYQAAQDGNSDRLEELIREWTGTNAMDWVDQDGWSPFHIACANGHLRCAKILGDLGDSIVDVNRASRGGYSPINSACIRGRLDVVKMLVEMPSIDLNKPDADGDRPLRNAGTAAIKDVLRAKGAR